MSCSLAAGAGSPETGSRLRFTFMAAGFASAGLAAVTVARVMVMALLIVVVLSHEASAQETPTRSTAAGVYSAEQAKRGRETFAGMCQSCHTPAQYAAPTFMGSWRGYTLWDLFSYLVGTMPKSDPGSLSPEEYAQVIAYLLELNDMPPGEDQLPADQDALRQIRLDSASTPAERLRAH